MKNDRKILIFLTFFIGVLFVVLGVSSASFTFDRNGANQELVLGDIWMKYTEANEISLQGSFPGDDYSKYFEFTITGKNTYEEKDIWYDIRLIKGSVPVGRTEDNRIDDMYLKFKLVEVNGEVETEILKDKTYIDLTNKTIHVSTIPKGSNSYTKTYRLYMVISDELKVGNVEGAMSSEEFETLFGSIKVATTGDFEEKEVPLPTLSETFKKTLLTRTNSYVLDDGTYYVSGTKDDNNPNTTDDIDFNYVWYSGKLWRITALYPDGTMKMVTDDLMTSISWGRNTTFSTSYINEWLNQEFLPTLYNYQNIINVEAGWYTIADTAEIPTKPTGDYTITSPVGLLSAYELYESYKNTDYKNGYLSFVDYRWWLITPYGSSNMYMAYGGYLSNSERFKLSLTSIRAGVRPSVVLISTVQSSSGSGTYESPYIIKGDMEVATGNTTLLNSRQSGEYVKIEGDEMDQLFRIVDTELITDSETNSEKLTTKLVLNDYLRESGNILAKTFGQSGQELWSEVSDSSTTYWRGYLNVNWIQNFNTSMLEKGMYYLGYSGGNYKSTVCSTASSEVSIKQCIESETVVSNTINTDYVGLLRYGEMFASQTNNDSTTNPKNQWLITPYNQAEVLYISYTTLVLGEIPYYDWASDSTNVVRPTINLTSTIVVKSGSGTEQAPFIVGLPS